MSAERRVDLGAGDNQTLVFNLEPVAVGSAASAAAGSMPSGQVAAETQGPSYAATWVAGVATVVLAGATAILAANATSAESDLRQERASASSEARLMTLQDNVETAALLTDVALGATIVSAIVTGVLLLAADGTEPGEDRKQDSASLAVGPSSVHLRVHARF